MKARKTKIPGLLIIEPDIFGDNRGYFYESYNLGKYNEIGIDANFIQDNESKSTKGVIRGLHYQLEPYSQAKLVRVISGSVFDVVVDIRKGSPTYGEWFGIELSDRNKFQLYIPRGFAHGFSVLSEEVIFNYKCDRFYNKQSERGIKYNDPELNIDWHISLEEISSSEKDMKLPVLQEAEINYTYNEL